MLRRFVLVSVAEPFTLVNESWVMLMPYQSCSVVPDVHADVASHDGQVANPALVSRHVVNTLGALAPLVSVASNAAPWSMIPPVRILTTSPWCTVIVWFAVTVT